MRIAKLFTVAFVSMALAACGGSGSGDDVVADDTVEPDADLTVAPDADLTVAKQIGDSCVPDAANPMGAGDCGAGMTCLQLDGGGGAWCSKTCTGASDTSCDAAFVGPGVGYCYLGVDFDGNGTSDGTYCGIICQDTTGLCTDCTNTCPTPLACSAELMAGTPPAVVAHGCQ